MIVSSTKKKKKNSTASFILFLSFLKIKLAIAMELPTIAPPMSLGLQI